MTTTATYGACPIKRKRRTKAEVESFDDALMGLAEAMHPFNPRAVFYQCVARGLVEKTETENKRIGNRLVELRRSGRMPHDWVCDFTRQRYKPRTHSSLEDMLEITRDTYRRALWEDQPRYCEIWTEKKGLMGTVYPVTAKYDVPLLPMGGYPSLSFLFESAQQIICIDKPTTIFYYGDWDPSGLDISRKIEEDLREFAPEVELEFVRSAVNEWQIEEWELPTRPTKKTDSRSKNFKGESVEVDAIPPQKLRELIEADITSHIDERRLKMTELIEDAERDALDQIIENMGGAA